MLIRAARLEDSLSIAKVQVDSWRTTYRGIVPDDYISSLTYERREPRWREFLAAVDDTFAFVAETNEKRIVGFVSGGANREPDQEFAGELHAIYLLESFQRQGVGRLLTNRLVKRFRQNRIDSMIVWVLAENPSRGFYERLGGEFVREKPIVIGGATLVEVAYGWRNIKTLL